MKKSLENDRARMEHMLTFALQIREYTADKSRADLDLDGILALAMVRLLEIIGEAASNVTTETQASYPDIEWREIIGMRNHIIHGYFDIEYDIVWNTILDFIPGLIAELETILLPGENQSQAE
jgi:uncharacterized protein with HEPN domain